MAGILVPDEQVCKRDEGKLTWSLLCWEQLKQVVEVRMFGDRKYAPGSWKGVSHSRYVEAAMRHLVSYMQGEKKDAESGKSHMAHLICCAMFCMFFDDQETQTKEPKMATKAKSPVAPAAKKANPFAQKAAPLATPPAKGTKGAKKAGMC